ncbi:Basic region leucine zipper [Nesidiocoris tenuis]|uniref:Basic region leucine zipper n=1 Tax=Nesidiocoris tenuis TaxID=355587 RepID=A0ABN7AD51_9HEMI|nr:Basic region leucine zipper [Nesidiocoris tenuis]
MDMKAKLERSRQSARECRARKKLRYQYLEELVTEREKAVLQLRREFEKYRLWSKDLDDDKMPEGLEAFLESYFDGENVKTES